MHVCGSEEPKQSTRRPLHKSVLCLPVINFALACQSDVQELSNIIGSKRETLQVLGLESIDCSVDDCNNQDSDESN
jgi:hypothetical protein